MSAHTHTKEVSSIRLSLSLVPLPLPLPTFGEVNLVPPLSLSHLSSLSLVPFAQDCLLAGLRAARPLFLGAVACLLNMGC